MDYQVSEDTKVIPATHVAIEKNFRKKQPKVKAKFDGMNNYFKSENHKKAKNLEYNLGTSLSTQYKNTEIVVGYNCNLQKKYQNHQGYIKLKLAF